jgi:hypothetical protein
MYTRMEQRVPLSKMRPPWVRAIATCYVHFDAAQRHQALFDFLSQAAQHIHPSVTGLLCPSNLVSSRYLM